MAAPGLVAQIALCLPAIKPASAAPGCVTLARQDLGTLPRDTALFWHLDVFQARSTAEEASLARSTIVEAQGTIWVFTIAPASRLVSGLPNARQLKESILRHHTAAVDVGAVAPAAGVKTLVLSHLVPAQDPSVTEAMWLEAARTHFRGEIVVGRDLLEF